MSVVGIISDTHENVRIILRALKIFAERSPHLVVHCGDIISPPVVERFAALPMRFVFGNNDGERSGLRKKCAELGFPEIQDTALFEIEGKSFFVNHGTNPRTIEDAVSTQSYDFVLHGHTHEMRDELIGRTRIINPGALFAAPVYSIAFLNVATGDVEFVEISD